MWIISHNVGPTSWHQQISKMKHCCVQDSSWVFVKVVKVFESQNLIPDAKLMIYWAAVFSALQYASVTWTTYNRYLKAVERYRQTSICKILQLFQKGKWTNQGITEQTEENIFFNALNASCGYLWPTTAQIGGGALGCHWERQIHVSGDIEALRKWQNERSLHKPPACSSPHHHIDHLRTQIWSRNKSCSTQRTCLGNTEKIGKLCKKQHLTWEIPKNSVHYCKDVRFPWIFYGLKRIFIFFCWCLRRGDKQCKSTGHCSCSRSRHWKQWWLRILPVPTAYRWNGGVHRQHCGGLCKPSGDGANWFAIQLKAEELGSRVFNCQKSRNRTMKFLQ